MFVNGTYRHNKADWFGITESGQAVANWQRFATAHGTSILNSIQRSFCFELEGTPGTNYPNPDSDATYRDAQHNAATRLNVADGGDFLWKGNYIHPTAKVYQINGCEAPADCVLYYVGDNESYITTNDPPSRNWVQILTATDLTQSPYELTNGGLYRLDVMFGGTAPDPVVDLIASPLLNAVDLSWTGPVTADYVVQWKKASDTNWVEYYVVSSTTVYQVTLLEVDTNYNFSVSHYTGDRNSSYVYVDAKTDSGIPLPPNLNITATGYRSLEISWTSVLYADSYTVEYYNDLIQSWDVWEVTTGGSSSITDLAPNTFYGYRVCSNNDVYGSGDYAYIDMTTPEEPTIASVTVSLNHPQNTTAQVEWASSPLAAAYDVYSKTGIAGDPYDINSYSRYCGRYTGTSLNYDVSGYVVYGQIVWFAVSGYGDYGNGPLNAAMDQAL